MLGILNGVCHIWILGETIPTTFVYIGLKDRTGDNQLSSYKWAVDHSVMSYSNFARSEPSQARERCVAFGKQSYQWNDVLCNIRLTAVCEATGVSI